MAGDVVVLEPGEYETHGPWASSNGNINVASGVTIKAGSATILLVAPSGITRIDHDLPILRCGADVVIEGGTWDCNHMGNPGWFCQGIRFHGRFRLICATVIGMSGSRASGTPSGAVESFAVSSEGDTGGSMVERVTVKSCKSNDPDDYVSGIFLGTTGDVEGAEESIVRDCRVNLGAYGQFAYSSNGPTRFEGCTGTASRFWYNDTGDTFGARIISCSGVGNYAAISCVSTPGGTVRQVHVQGGQFRFPRGVEWWDQSNEEAINGEVVALDVDFRCAHPASTAARTGSVTFARCMFPHGAQSSVAAGSILPVFHA
jgi:hypothetical protein